MYFFHHPFLTISVFSFLFCNSFFSVAAFPLWTSSKHVLWYKNTDEFRLKGLNWFGFETNCRVVHGLWATPIDEFFEFMANEKYNALRIPLSYELMNSLDEPANPDCLGQNPWMVNMPVRDLLHMMLDKARVHQMVILFDFHTINSIITEGPSTDVVSILDVRNAWYNILREYHSYSNLLGIDIKNEPHGISWKEWGQYAVGFIRQVQHDFPDFQGLFFVEGIQDLNDQSVWGGSFSNMPEDVRDMLGNVYSPRVVFSPHVYGVSIRGTSAVYDDDNLFHTWFGFIQDEQNNIQGGIVIGEVGGFYILDDYEWHEKLLRYLQSNNITNAFYWCLNPDSIDTQGVLQQDWKTPNQGKLDFHHALQPNPTFLRF